MKRFPSLLLLLAGWGLVAAPRPAQAGPPKEDFAVSAIPAGLADGVHVVVRLETHAFAVHDPGSATTRVRRVVTILDPNGREAGVQAVWYDKFRTLAELRGVLRDADGRVVRKLGRADVRDLSATADFSLYDDNRVRVAELYHDAYPYTVEFEYELKHRGLVSWPSYHPQGPDEAVQQASFEVSVPARMPVRYRARHLARPEPEIRESGSRRIYRWTVSGLRGVRLEEDGPSAGEQLPTVEVASSAFEIDGHAGDMSTWEAFGSWYHALGAGRDVLPPEAAGKVRELVRDAGSEREKVRRLYEHLQATTRYVSVQLGIGGWQPFDAAYVVRRGYGDCKALTNYLMAMLKAAGVASYPALVRAGEGEPDVAADFPSNRFNHVILFVPLAADTLWLEATSQTAPFGHLGTFTEDRNALVVTPAGGRLLRTPRSRPSDNRQLRRATVAVDEAGHATAAVETRYTGNQQDRVRQALARATARDREIWLRDALDLPAFRLVRADYSQLDRREPEIVLPVELELPRYASRTGTRLFIRLNLMERWTQLPGESGARTQPVRIPYAFLDADSITYRIPEGFSVEALPPPVAVETPFGSYHASVEPLPDGSLCYRRRLEMRETALPPEAFESYRTFVGRIVRADRAQAVLARR